MTEVNSLEYTPPQEIDEKIRLANDYFIQKQLKISKASSPRKADYKMRSLQLKKLYYAIKDHEQDIIEAMSRDFNRSPTETMTFELIPLYNNILNVVDKLQKWMTPQKIADRSALFFMSNIEIEKIARGSALIIGPFNFPFFMSLGPVAYAIAGGNSVILKPSELLPSCDKVMDKILASAEFPYGLAQIVQGSVSETEKLIKSGKFDIIFFTGSPRVGSIIAQNAAKSLTPCVLELGGKSPTFITGSFKKKNLHTAIKRIFFGTFGNSGQICVAPDYVLVHESVYNETVDTAKKVLKDFYPEIGPNTEYTHMVNKKAFDDTLKKLDSTEGKVFNVDNQKPERASFCIPPTLAFDVNWDDSLMTSENFAPVIPFVKYSKLDDAIDKILENCDTPLAQYIFSGSNQEIQHILTRVRSGACIVGDTIIHPSIIDAPFGGIGGSGYGNHGGIYGFNAFTHERTVLRQPFWIDTFLSIRYPPLSNFKKKSLAITTEKKPCFDRNGANKLTCVQMVFVSGLILCSALIYHSYTRE